MINNLPAMMETWVQSLGEGHGSPLQYSCLENPHGQRNLGGYGLWGRKESDTTEATEHMRSSYINHHRNKTNQY